MSETNNEKRLYETEEQNVEAANVNEILDDTEQKSLNELQTLKEENNEANTEVINEAEGEIKKIFSDLRKWISQNSDPETIKQNLENAKNQTLKVLDSARKKVIEVSDSEEFKKTVEAGKDFLKGTGSLIGEGFKDLKDALAKNPTMKKIFDNTDEQIDKLRSNENLKDAVDKVQEVSGKISEAIFNGINSFFKPEANKENTDDNSEQNKE